MSNRLISLTERELRDIVKAATQQVLSEMAVKRGDYVQYCIGQSSTVLKHIGKICVYENDPKMSHWVRHWEDEIATQVYDLGKIDITKDNKACKIKKKAFIESFIEGRLGKNFCEYDEKMPSYFIDGLEDEGLDKDQIRGIDINAIVAENKERIKEYLFSFVELISIKDLVELKEQCKKTARNFTKFNGKNPSENLVV